MDFSSGPVRYTVVNDTMSPALLKGDEVLIYPLERKPKVKDILLVAWRGELVPRRVVGFVHDATANNFLVQLADEQKAQVFSFSEEDVLGKLECS